MKMAAILFFAGALGLFLWAYASFRGMIPVHFIIFSRPFAFEPHDLLLAGIAFVIVACILIFASHV